MSDADPRGPVFCADAVADPISGLCGATGALASIVNGGGHLVDCSMAAASAFANHVAACGADHRTDGGAVTSGSWPTARSVDVSRGPGGRPRRTTSMPRGEVGHEGPADDGRESDDDHRRNDRSRGGRAPDAHRRQARRGQVRQAVRQHQPGHRGGPRAGGRCRSRGHGRGHRRRPAGHSTSRTGPTDKELRKRCIRQLQAALEEEKELLRAELVAEVGSPGPADLRPAARRPPRRRASPGRRASSTSSQWERDLPDGHAFGSRQLAQGRQGSRSGWSAPSCRGTTRSRSPSTSWASPWPPATR